MGNTFAAVPAGTAAWSFTWALQRNPRHILAVLQAADLVLDAVVVHAVEIGEVPVYAGTAIKLVAGAVVVNGRGIQEEPSRVGAVGIGRSHRGVLQVGDPLRIGLVGARPLVQQGDQRRGVRVKGRDAS